MSGIDEPMAASNPDAVDDTPVKVTLSSDDDMSSSSDPSSSDSDSDDLDNEKSEPIANEDNKATSPSSDKSQMTSSGVPDQSKSSARPNYLRNGLTGKAGRSPPDSGQVHSDGAMNRFRAQQNSRGSSTFLPLGTKKRDRRTIEEIQRDIRNKKEKQSSSSNNDGAQKPSKTSPPPRTSPVVSPESHTGEAPPPVSVNMSRPRAPRGRSTSTRSRLEKKVFGRGGATSASSRNKAKKAQSSSAGIGGMVTNISDGTVHRHGVASSATGKTEASSHDNGSNPSTTPEPGKPDVAAGDSKPDAKAVRSVQRAMIRYADLSEVGLYKFDGRGSPSSASDSTDSFVSRSNLPSLTKLSSERLVQIAKDMASRCRDGVEEKQDVVKYADVELKAPFMIERMYENLKLRLAIQRLLRKFHTDRPRDLVSKHECTISDFDFSTECPAWNWAEKAHHWNARKDAALLIGIYVHGFGGWEDMLYDDSLHFERQRALKGERLKKRAENLVKRLYGPNGEDDPPIVHKAAALTASKSQPTNTSLGAKLSDIINNGGHGSASSGKSSRMQRAADRFAARQEGSAPSQSVDPGDSIRREHTKVQDAARGDGSSRQNRHISSQPGSPEEGEEEEGEALVEETQKAPNGREASAVDTSKTKRKRMHGAGEENGKMGGVSRKKAKQSKESSSQREDTPVALTEDELREKWRPKDKLKPIRNVMKKMRAMEKWSKGQSDEAVVEKMLKYVTEIGDMIDNLIRQADPDASNEHRLGVQTHREWDELCNALWQFAAKNSLFAAVDLEQLYDDICADAAVAHGHDTQS